MNDRPTQSAVTIVAVLLLLVTACVQVPKEQGISNAQGEASVAGRMFPKNADGYADITAEQLSEMMGGKEFTLVNTHIPYAGDLPQTDLTLPYDQIPNYLDQLPDRNAPIVLYCRSGSMSTSAAVELAALGYTNVMELDGGMRAWTAAGNELVRQ
jgi:rhodanese-related sulfurtransferase